MHRKLTLAMVALAAAIGLMAALAPATATAQDDDDHETRIHIRKVIDGDVTELHGEGGGHRWFAGPHGKEMMFEMGGFGPGAFLGVGTTGTCAGSQALVPYIIYIAFKSTIPH